MIDILLPLSLANGVSLFYLKNLLTPVKKNIFPVILIVIAGIVFIFLGALYPKYYQGLGYIPRNEVKKVAEFISENTPVNMPIHAPHYIANEAHRLKIIDYEELIGPYRLMINRLSKKDDFEKNLYANGWYDLIVKTLPLWRYELDNAIMEKKVSCVVWDRIFPEWSLMLNIDIHLETNFNFFSSAGFNIRYNTRYYTVWLTN